MVLKRTKRGSWLLVLRWTLGSLVKSCLTGCSVGATMGLMMGSTLPLEPICALRCRTLQRAYTLQLRLINSFWAGPSGPNLLVASANWIPWSGLPCPVCGTNPQVVARRTRTLSKTSLKRPGCLQLPKRFFCRLFVISIQGLIMISYQNEGFGSPW